MVDGGVLPLCAKKFGSIYRLTLAGPQRPRHIIQGNSLHLSFIIGIEGGGESFDSQGERGGIVRSQQSVKEGIWKLYCQLTAKRGAGGGGGGGGGK